MSKKIQLIAIGECGTSFVRLNDKQLASLKLNEENVCLAKLRLSDEQLASYKAGRNSGALWVDSASWLASRDGKFWLGELSKALQLGLVREALATVQSGDKKQKLVCYVRKGWNAAERYDHSYATERGVNGRIETRTISDKRNTVYVRRVLNIDFDGSAKAKGKKVAASAKDASAVDSDANTGTVEVK